MSGIGHWRKPTSLLDAKQMTDYIIDNTDPAWLIAFGSSSRVGNIEQF